MTITQAPPSEMLEINSLTEEIERRQVILSPDVRAYLHEETENLVDKLSQGQPVTEEDIAFVAEVRMWIEMPEEFQEKLLSVDAMKGNEDVKNAKKRRISPQQWLDLLHVAESYDKEREWIDEAFTFAGGGRIETDNLIIPGRVSLTHLPENLKVRGNIFLVECTSLRHLPDDLEVGGDVDLQSCKSLTHLPENFEVSGDLNLQGCASLTHLPDNLRVGGFLGLRSCTALTHIPENLEVGSHLDIVDCTSLTYLPDNLMVGGELRWSEDLNDQVMEDTKRLYEEGKIKGEIRRVIS